MLVFDQLKRNDPQLQLLTVMLCVGFAMLFAGHYLQLLFLKWFNFDLKEHLEVIVVGIVLVTTAPILIKLFFGKKKSPQDLSA